MHILVIPSQAYVPPESPLSGIFQEDQVLALKKTGLEVGVITIDLVQKQLLGKMKAGTMPGFQMEQKKGVTCHRFRFWNWFSVFGDSGTWPWLQVGLRLFKRYLRLKGRPDLIHAHNGVLAGQLAREIKKRFHIPYVVTEHSSYVARQMMGERTLARIGRAYNDCSVLIAVSTALGETLENLYGDKARPWVTIPNMLGRLFVKQPVSVQYATRKKGTFRFLNIGNLQEVKGHTHLIRAFHKYYRNDHAVQLRIGGDGSLREDLKQLIHTLGMTRRIQLLGYLDRSEVLREMAACDAFVFPSLYETFGVVLIEALACGKPVISTACGGPADIVNDTNGMLVPVGDVDDLGRAMIAMRSQIGQYDGEKIRKNCIASFGEAAVTSQLTTAYERVVRNGLPKGSPIVSNQIRY